MICKFIVIGSDKEFIVSETRLYRLPLKGEKIFIENQKFRVSEIESVYKEKEKDCVLELECINIYLSNYD